MTNRKTMLVEIQVGKGVRLTALYFRIFDQFHQLLSQNLFQRSPRVQVFCLKTSCKGLRLAQFSVSPHSLSSRYWKPPPNFHNTGNSLLNKTEQVFLGGLNLVTECNFISRQVRRIFEF